jgi:uncharacterized protein (TIGR00255 family)
MIKSMTGYGRAESVEGGEKITVEVKTSNHRYCDVFLRIPQKCFSLENDLKKIILSRITRGRVDLSIQIENEKEEELSLELNLSLAERYYLLLKELKESLQLPGDVSLKEILTQKDLIVSQCLPQSPGYGLSVLQGPLSAALDELVKMREVEGAVLKDDILSRLKKIELLLGQINSTADASVRDHQRDLARKIESLCSDVTIDESRLAQEAAYLAERSDITEELVRTGSHLSQLGSWLDADDAVGRRLDFLIQEIHREINTIGSKSYYAEISVNVVEIKNELEKIREQVQNIE